ncbi:MAG TPA: hypothetical protein VF108_09855 [Actinomycetota bacterium]
MPGLDTLPLVGSVRGFRWWRLGGGLDLCSPWRGPVRWTPGENEAACLGRHRAVVGWRTSKTPHPRGSPEVACECGFYALHAIPEMNGSSERSIWEIDSRSSGGRHGLILGVAEGYGRVLIGTKGWRARFGRILALYVAPWADDIARPVNEVAARYRVPLYRSLEGMASEWGPDRDTVERLIA